LSRSKGRQVNQATKLSKTNKDITERKREAYSFSPSFTCVPPYSGRRTVSPSFTETGMICPCLSRSPGPTARTFPELSYINSQRIKKNQITNASNNITYPETEPTATAQLNNKHARKQV